MRFLFALLLLFPLASCQRHILKVRSEPLFPSYLASERIDTPDPNRFCFFGEQIVIHWNLPSLSFCVNGPFTLYLTVRFGDLCAETYEYSVERKSGYWVVPFIRDDYFQRKGILSFKVELYQGEELLETWKHHVWVEILSIGEN